MRNRIFFTLVSLASVIFSSPLLAHGHEAGSVLPHILTGEHLLILVLAGACVAGAARLYRRSG